MSEEKTTTERVIEGIAAAAPDLIKFGIGLIVNVTKFLSARAGISVEEIQRQVKLELDETAKALAEADLRDSQLYTDTHPGED